MKSPHLKGIAATEIDANSVNKMGYAINIASQLVNRGARRTCKAHDHITMYQFVLNQESGYYESDPDLDEILGLDDE